MTQEIKNLLNGILSLILLVPLPTIIIHTFNSFQNTGCIIILNEAFSKTSSYIIITALVLFTLYLFHKTLRSLCHFLLSI